jgi:biopolymer transport protein ExbB
MVSLLRAPQTAARKFDTAPSSRPLRIAAAVLALGAGLAATPASAQQFEVARNLTVASMIGDADPLVKAVMACLFAASMATWTIFIAKSMQLASAKRRLRRDLEVLEKADSLPAATQVSYPASAAMVDLARRELRRTTDLRGASVADGVKERVAARLGVVETNAIQSILAGVGILASVGATAPFVGLAGTVWGIMNSFIGISKAHTTNLAVVAPGIAEALLATAMGLMAAIPAVLIYNMLARSIAGYRRLIAEAAVLTACALSRELESKPEGAAAETPTAKFAPA